MSKLATILLLATFTIFSNCNQRNTNLDTATQPAQTNSQAAIDNLTPVTILFSGLMVFHQKSTGAYEVGILKVGSHHHEISVNGIPIHKNLGEDLAIEIVPTPSPTPMPSPTPVPVRSSRRPDVDAEQWDFNWIINFEREFHPGAGLRLRTGRLKIIHLPYGPLFTLYKSMDLQRSQGGGAQQDFGFVPETIALSLKLERGQRLVLKNKHSQAVTLAEYKESIPSNWPGYLIAVRNQRQTGVYASDFSAYYSLFENAPPRSQRYDFTEKRDGREHPRNPFPGYEPTSIYMTGKVAKKTCCMMACTAILVEQPLR